MSGVNDESKTSLAEILRAMGVVSTGTIGQAAQKYRENVDEKIANTLLASGRISREDLDKAKRLQTALRSGSKHRRALAQADIAHYSSESTVRKGQRLRDKVSEVRRKTTGAGHPAVTAAMLAELAVDKKG